jgi:probable HAF family extracellular repeat protein
MKQSIRVIQTLRPMRICWPAPYGTALHWTRLIAALLLFVLKPVAHAQLGGAASTGPVANVTDVSAQLTGSFLENAREYTAAELGWFDYGTTTSYGSSTAGYSPLGHSFFANYYSDSGFISANYSTAFNSAFTIEAWVNTDGYGVNMTILSTTANAPGNNSKVRLSLNYDAPRFEVWDSSGNYYDSLLSPTAIPTQQWVHIAVTLDPTIPGQGGNMPCSIYVNGQVVASKTFSYESRSIGNRQMYIGRSTWLHSDNGGGDGGYPFYGFISEVRVWNTALSQATIQTWMNQSVNSSHPNYYNLFHYFRFDEAQGSTSTDYGQLPSPGTPYNNPTRYPFGGQIWVTSPPQLITGLVPGTTYHYVADLGNNTHGSYAVGQDQTFTTLGPTLAPIVNQTVSKDIGPKTIVLGGISKPSATGGPLVFTATSSNPSVIPNPTIVYTSPNPTGTLTFTPQPNTTGTSVVTVAGSYISSVGTTGLVSQSFTILVTNLPPVVGPGASLALNGKNQFIAVPSGTWFSNQFTVESWVYLKTNSVGAKLFDFGNGPGQDSVFAALVGPGGGPRLSVFPTNASNGLLDSTTPIPFNQWAHVAFTRDTNGNGHIYLNGVQIATGPLNAPTTALRTNDFIGQSEWSGDPNLNARVSDFRVWNIALTAQQLTNNWSSALSRATTGLVLDYRFNEGTGAIVNNSATADGAQNGTLSYTTPFYSATGSGPDYALSLDGSTGYVDLPDGVWFNGDFTVESWVYLRSYNSWSRVFDFGNNGYLQEVYLALSAGGSGVPAMGVFGVGNGPVLTANTQFPLNQWAHIAATLSGSTGTIYINGAPVGSATLNVPSNVVRTNNFIGRSNFAGDAYANAAFDEVRIWSSARTSAQIQADMAHALTGTEPGLQDYWKFDEGTGSATADQTGNSVTGKLVGRASYQSITNGPVFFAPDTPFGYVLSFNGNNGYVSVAPNNSLNPYPLTSTVWIKTTQTNYCGLVNKYFASSLNGYQLLLNQGHINAWYFRDQGDNVYGNLDGGFVADGLWHNLAFVVDSAGGRIYVDGLQTASLPWTGIAGPTTTSMPLAFGLYPGNPGVNGLFSGQMDEVTLWNTNLTSAQIQAYMTTPPLGNEPGLLGYWRFDEGVGFLSLDETPNGNLGTFIGTPSYAAATNGPGSHISLGSKMALNIGENTPAPLVLPGFDIDSIAVWTNINDINGPYEGGTFNLNPTNGQATYTPEPNYYGPVTIAYSVSDGQLSSSNTINLIVQHIRQPPVTGDMALNMNGSNNEVRVTGFGSIAPGSEVTIEFWQNVAAMSGQQNIFSIDYGTPDAIDAQLSNTGNSGAINWDFGTGHASYQFQSSILHTWHHFALVSSQSYQNGNGVMQIFMDGQPVTARTGGGAFTPGNFDLRLGTPSFSGALSEFRVWNIARTPAQILGSMNVPLAGNEPGLVAYYRFNEDSGITVHNNGPSQGLSYDGLVIGGAPYPAWISGPPSFGHINLASFSSNNLVVLPGFDPDVPASGLSWTITDTTSLNGTLVPSGGNWLYTPTPGYNGPASFTYSVSDGVLSNSATVFIAVAPQIPPVISAIPNQLILENTSTAPIPFSVSSAQTTANNLIVSVVGDNQVLLDTDDTTGPNSGFSLNTVPGTGGTNLTLVLTPINDQSGSTLITITVSDGRNTVSTNFILQVTARPVYTVIDLGVLPSRFASFGNALNDLGQVVGYCTDGSPGQNQKLAFLYSGFNAGGQLINIGTLGGISSAAYGLNSLGQVVGTAQLANGTPHVFFYDSLSHAMSDYGALGTNSGSSSSVGYGINSNAFFVGQSSTAATNQLHAFLSGSPLRDLGGFGSATFSVATAINDAGQVVGYGQVGPYTNAFLLPGPVTNGPAPGNFLGGLPGGNNSLAFGLNQFGDVVGAADVPVGNGLLALHAWLRISGSTSNQDLGLLPGGLTGTAYGINDFRQVVGTTTRTDGSSRAFLYTVGQLFDLNDLLPNEETNVWSLADARAINSRGEIVGTGIINGHQHAFLALPAREMGKPIARPLGTIAQQPAIDIIDPASPDDTSGNAFFWSNPDKRLYAIRPVTALIHWQTGAGLITNGTGTNFSVSVATVDVLSKSVWPRSPQIHVAGSPVEVEPQAGSGGPPVPFGYSFSSAMYTTSPGANVDANTKIFSAVNPGYTVLRYLVKNGSVADPLTALSHFEVVRTVAWNDPGWLVDAVPATIGTPLTNPTHFDYQGRTGFVLPLQNQKSVYDGVGPNRAYDPTTRVGTIIAVNQVNKKVSPPDDDLVVVWYHTNSIGVTWADSPYRYFPQWPASDTNDPTKTLVIANVAGSGPLDPLQFVNAYPYAQNDPTLPGFNPNEEHALMLDNAVYALRDDLNALYGNLSLPYVLLKYQDPTAGNAWRFRVYQVIETYGSNQFTYPGTAGQEIQPPLPLSGLQLCTSSNIAVSGPSYKAQLDGKLYARAAGLNGSDANITVHYWYPIQPTFYTGVGGPGVGTCVPWLDRGTGTPIDANYDIHWPTDYGTMNIGETLTTAHSSSPGNLPDITDLINATIIYDDLNPSGDPTVTNSARLYDPFSPRSVSVASPDILSTFKQANLNGVVLFPDLPYFLRLRLAYDPINQLLSFKGLMAPTTPGADPVLLDNVLSARERDAIKATLSGNITFNSLIDQLYDLTRNPNRLTLNPPGISLTQFDKALLIGLTLATNGTNVAIVPQTFGAGGKALTAGLFGVPPVQPYPPGSTNYPPRFVTVVQDDPTVPGSVVQMAVIRIDNGPFAGYLAVLPGDNVFDPRLTLHHSADFGGDPGQLQFEWYYHEDSPGFDPTALPVVNPDGTIDPQNLKGWHFYTAQDRPDGVGANYVTIGEGGESGLLTMSDNWFISRYEGYNIRGQTNWSAWVGQPGGGRAQFAQGWVNRVLAGLNPFEARSSDFHNSPIVTYASMLQQAGERYEGDIALNADPNYLNQVGLIQAYSTVLHIGEGLSINGTPPVNYAPANQALLNAASRTSDFYVLLGNEAAAEEADPTIGFKNSSAQFGSLASSIFAFQDQLSSLLDQELCLLRGRDDSAASVRSAPVYNRLLWNFTGGNGEVAYVQVFDIKDVNNDGFINASDARIMFPQGHGDAWGHYLTALTTYYNLLKNPNFTWIPRAETVPLADGSVLVNYQDERKFAHAAAAKAQTGQLIVNLTYRSSYVDDPSGQYQGYKDTNPDRAWGVSEWARRAGQGAFFDWLTANAILPAVDPNTNDVGITRIDRTTVSEIDQIPAAALEIQSQLDKADAGLNPLGLAKNVVPFDIDPSLIAAGQTHFEQIYSRAVSAMVNASAVWDQANAFTSGLRQQQDTVNQFSQNVQSQDQDYKNRMIEIFGYPFAGDIGASGAYPDGYDGPDLYHYMYLDTSQFQAGVQPPSGTITGYFQPMSFGSSYFSADTPSTVPQLTGSTNVLTVSYPMSDSIYNFQPPSNWGQRRAPGEIQMALSDLLQSQGNLEKSIETYNNLVQQVQDSTALLQAHYNLKADNISVQSSANIASASEVAGALAAKAMADVAKAQADEVNLVTDAAVESIPKVEGLADDGLSSVRGSIKAASSTYQTVMGGIAVVADGVAEGALAAAVAIQAQASQKIAANNLNYELAQQLAALQELVQQLTPARTEIYTLREAVTQKYGRYLAALSEGQRIGEQRAAFAKQAAAQTQTARYQDMTFRIFQNDAIQKYRAQFDLAQRYVFLAAMAYDFETQLLGGSTGSGQQFLTDIIRQQSLGEMNNGAPINGVQGLADPLARLSQNFAVLKGQLGFNNPQTETGKFSLRYGLFRQRPGFTNVVPLNAVFTNDWPTELKNHIVPDLWQIPEFRRYCRPFAPESAGPQPGLVIRFSTTVTFGLNFFGWPLSGGDSAYDPTLFATKVRSVGAWFAGYDNSGLSTTPRIYLIPVGADVLRSPSGNDLATREWKVVDQQLPVPFPLGASTLSDPAYIPINDSLSGTMEDIRRFSSFLAYTDQGDLVDSTQVTTDSRLIGRSVWNTDWMLIIPGGTLLSDPELGLEGFVNSVSDIKIFFQTYSYSGN